MRVKRSGKYITGADLTAAERKAMNMEIARQLAVFTRKYKVEIESIYLRELRTNHNFGETRLRRAFDNFGNDLDELIRKYELGEEDKFWVAQESLKEEGFDVEKWHREKYGNREEEV